MTRDIDGASKRLIAPTRPTRPIRREQLRQLVPLSDTTIYGLEMQGRFLQQVISGAAQLQAALAEPDYKRRFRDGAAWLGQSA